MMLEKIIEKLLIKELGEEVSPVEQFWTIGKNYHIRSVTMDFAGELKSISEKEIILTNASWVADSGRFSEYLKDTSKINENEPYQNDVLINRSAITDATEIGEVFTGVK